MSSQYVAHRLVLIEPGGCWAVIGSAGVGEKFIHIGGVLAVDKRPRRE